MMNRMTATQPNTEDNIKEVNRTKKCTQGNNQDLFTYIKTSSTIYPTTDVCSTFSNTFYHTDKYRPARLSEKSNLLCRLLSRYDWHFSYVYNTTSFDNCCCSLLKKDLPSPYFTTNIARLQINTTAKETLKKVKTAVIKKNH